MKRTTMKRMIALGTILGLALATIPFGQSDVAVAKRKKKKKEYTGTYENGLFNDKKYGLSVEIPDSWNVKLMPKGENVRFVAEKVDYSIPVAYIENEFLTVAPMIKLFIDTSSLKPRAFIDSLKAKTFSSEQKKEIYKSFKIFDGKTKRPIVSRLKLKSGAKGIRARILRRYHLEVPRGVGQPSDIVTDNLQGDLAFFKSPDDKYIIIISGVCESLYYRGVNEPTFKSVFESLTFANGDKSDTK